MYHMLELTLFTILTICTIAGVEKHCYTFRDLGNASFEPHVEEAIPCGNDTVIERGITQTKDADGHFRSEIK